MSGDRPHTADVTPSGPVERVVMMAVLIALCAVAAVWAVHALSLRAALMALSCAYGASRLARGLPLDDPEDGDGESD